MNTRQQIRASLIIALTIYMFLIGSLIPLFPIYLELLKLLTTPYLIMVSGYFAVEGIKNLKKNKDNEIK